jgi:prepilin-type N-terminal cleavage/methylation domain-containing protein
MKREKGFSLIEMMTAMAILLIVCAAAINALVQAQRVTQGVALEATTQENLRAGMHFMVKDLTQAGEGLPPGGISIPNSSSAVSALKWPGTSTTFNTNYVVLTGVVPGSSIGQLSKGVNASTGAVITTGAVKTDVVTVIYADNSLIDSSTGTNQPYLNSYPVVQTSGSKTCAGTLTAAAVTLDSGCFKMPGTGPTPVAAGNLIMFENQYGTALEYVTAVAGQTITFASGDPAGLNAVSAATYPNGTVAALLAQGSVPTTITRIWMVTYYLDSTTNPTHPQLVRQLNYAGWPSVAAPANAPQPIADDIEDLGFTYDIINSTAPNGTYPNGAGDAPTPACWSSPCSSGSDTPQQIRAVNAYLAGRSENPYQLGRYPTFFHNNLSTQVSIRSMAFTNNFNTSITAPQ